MKRLRLRTILFFAAVAAVAPDTRPFAAASGSLEAGFSRPPRQARPRVWWHSIDGDVTKEGAGVNAWLETVLQLDA